MTNTMPWKLEDHLLYPAVQYFFENGSLDVDEENKKILKRIEVHTCEISFQIWSLFRDDSNFLEKSIYAKHVKSRETYQELADFITALATNSAFSIPKREYPEIVGRPIYHGFSDVSPSKIAYTPNLNKYNFD